MRHEPSISRVSAIALAVVSMAMAALATPHAAHADVRPRVEVFVAGPPRAAEAGRVFSGVLEFQAGARMTLDSLRLSGDRWRIRRFCPPRQRTLEPSGRLRVSFSAVPADPRHPLELQFRASGTWVRKSFDLSPEAVQRVRGPGGVTPRPAR